MAKSKKTLSITVPFKESEKWMYDIISTHSSKSAYIKDILSVVLMEKNTNPIKNVETPIPKTNNTNMDSFLDF